MISFQRLSGGLCVLVVGCGGVDSNNAYEVVDSAGVRVVSYVDGWRDELPRAVVADEPVYRIGEVDGEDAYLLTHVVAAMPVPGGIVIAEGQSEELRRFDGEGAFMKAVGGRGGGPEEFGNLQFADLLSGDTIIVWDSGNRRVARLTPDLEFVGTEQWAFAMYVPYVLDAFPDGTFLPSVMPGTSGGERVGPFNQTAIPLVRANGTFREHDTIDHVLSCPSFRASDGQPVPIPFLNCPSYTAVSDGIWAGDGSSGKLFHTTLEGRRKLEIRLPLERSVTEEEVEAYKAAVISDADEEMRPVLRRRLSEVPSPDFHPVFTGIRPNTDGSLWVRIANVQGGSGQHWVVFDSTGIARRVVELPSNISVLTLRGSRLIGTTRNEFDVVSLVELDVR